MTKFRVVINISKLSSPTFSCWQVSTVTITISGESWNGCSWRRDKTQMIHNPKTIQLFHISNINYNICKVTLLWRWWKSMEQKIFLPFNYAPLVFIETKKKKKGPRGKHKEIGFEWLRTMRFFSDAPSGRLYRFWVLGVSFWCIITDMAFIIWFYVFLRGWFGRYLRDLILLSTLGFKQSSITS